MALWTPAEIATALWLDAADSSTLFDAVSGGSLVAADGAVARWEDKSGNGKHVSQSSIVQRPIRKTAIQNSSDVVRFDGSNDGMLASTPLIFGSGNFSIYFAATAAGGGGTFASNRNGNLDKRAFWASDQFVRISPDGTIGAETLYTLPSPITSSSIVGITKVGTSYTVRINGNATGSFSGPASIFATNEPYTLGLQAATLGIFNPLNGDFFENVYFLDANILTNQTLEGYLAWKWGLQANLPADHPYKNAAPSTGSSAAAVHFFTFGF